MKKVLMFNFIAGIVVTLAFFSACSCSNQKSSASAETQAVEAQQSQYQVGQPIPAFNWSLERHLLTELYKLRNRKVATHAVWRSDYGMIEGDCPSMGYGIPYDTSLTNPLVATDISQSGHLHHYNGGALTSIEQPEPNGIFASKNTQATWVMCIGGAGGIEPVYVESHVTIYPGPVHVDYGLNRVTRTGKASVEIQAGK